MKVIVHAGCAKNGSTAFQTLMGSVGPGLATHGLCYPKAPVGFGHRHLAERAYLDDYLWVSELMDTARAADANCILLSTEHFQNLLCQKAYALGLVSAFREAGAGDVRFIFSVRAPFDYFQSIYAEAAKWFPISYEQSARAALHQGIFWTAWEGMIPTAYVFDYAAFGELRRFLTTAGPGAGLDCWELSDFARGFAGRRLLAEAGVPDAVLDEIEAGLASGRIAVERNIRRAPDQVELLHAQQFLFGDTAFLPAQRGSEVYPALVDLTARVANRRLGEIECKREVIRARFAERFADWRKCLSDG